MLTEQQIEAICYQLSSTHPFVSYTAAFELGWVTAGAYSTIIDAEPSYDEKWNIRFVFLLLVLAAEGVPYDC